MKLKYIIALAFLIAFSLSQDEEACVTLTRNPTSKKDCNGKLSQAEKDSNFKYCCYLESGTYKQCIAYTQEMYDLIGKAKSYSGGTTSTSEGKIECNSSYLKLGLLSLLFFIF